MFVVVVVCVVGREGGRSGERGVWSVNFGPILSTPLQDQGQMRTPPLVLASASSRHQALCVFVLPSVHFLLPRFYICFRSPSLSWLLFTCPAFRRITASVSCHGLPFASRGRPDVAPSGIRFTFTLPDLVSSGNQQHLNSNFPVLPRTLLHAIAVVALQSVQTRICRPSTALVMIAWHSGFCCAMTLTSLVSSTNRFTTVPLVIMMPPLVDFLSGTVRPLRIRVHVHFDAVVHVSTPEVPACLRPSLPTSPLRRIRHSSCAPALAAHCTSDLSKLMSNMPCGCVGVPALSEDSHQTVGDITTSRNNPRMAWGKA